MTTLLKDLLDHQAWADAVFFQAWGQSAFREDPELRARTAHLVEAQEAFLCLLKGDPPPKGGPPDPDLPALKSRCRGCHDAFLALGRGLDEASLASPIRVPWLPDPPCVVSVGEALAQVCLHTQHHRGQNMSRLRALGGLPRNVDYLLWLWKRRPKGRW